MSLRVLPATGAAGDTVQPADLYQPLLYGLLAMGQQDLAWRVAKAAYR
jgi:hypothetical protein